MFRIIFGLPKITALSLLFFILSFILVFFKYTKKWEVVQGISRFSVRVCQLTSRVAFLKKWGYKNLSLIKRFLNIVFIFSPVQNVCTERMLLASLVYSFIGVRTKMVLGVRFKPTLMHIWLEDEEGHVVI